MTLLSDYIGADRVPRKFKKQWLGRRLNKSKLRRLLSTVKIIESGNGRDSNEVLPYTFCPKCGCQSSRSTGNMAEYPERWDRIFCMRCNFLVGESDNSPYYHCLEFKEFDYVI